MAPPRKPRDRQKSGDGSTLEDVQVYAKHDLANPESPVLAVRDDGVNVSARDPEPKTVKAGDTSAAHEAHVEPSSPDRIAERIEMESGDSGLPTDVIARRQQEDAYQAETGRLDIEGDSTTARADSLLTDQEVVTRDQAREIRERRARENKEGASEDASSSDSAKKS